MHFREERFLFSLCLKQIFLGTRRFGGNKKNLTEIALECPRGYGRALNPSW